MKDNPIHRLARRRLREYQQTVSRYGPRAEQLLTKHKASPYNQTFIQRWLFSYATSLSRDTQALLVADVDEVILRTIEFYNKRHKGTRLSRGRRDDLFMAIRREFLLSEYKGATVDQRISQADRRLKVNLNRELQTLVTGHATGQQDPQNLINSITGTGYQFGGTALRWNSRLVMSEMYRAYQFTGKVVLAELGVEAVEWRNSPRHKPNGAEIDGYAEKTYSPEDLPDYPYPCNDSYFVPIY